MYVDPTGTFDNSAIIDMVSSLFEIGIGSALAIGGWAVKTGARSNNVGIGIFNKIRASKISSLTKASKVLSKISTAMGIVSVLSTVVDGIRSDINRDYSTGRIISNAVTNTLVYGGLTIGIGALGGYIGSLFGSVVPGLGNVVGAIFGFALGTLVGFILDIKVNSKCIIDHIRDAVYGFWKWLFG